MPIPGPGPSISMTTIATEFGGSVPHSLSEYYRGGGLVPNTPTNAAIPTSGTISMGNFYGSANRVAYTLTIAANTYNYDVYTNRGPSYSPGSSDITVQINPGVTVGSTSLPAYAMLVPSSFSPGDTITIVNNGVIQGMGGTGGNGGAGSPTAPGVNAGATGGAGGNALYVNRPTTVTNNGTIASGGGGGGGGGSRRGITPGKQTFSIGGSGGGGGAGFNGGGAGSGGPAPVAVGGQNFPQLGTGNAGQAGSSPAGGAGGPARGDGPFGFSGAGGAGGGRGAAGSAGQAGPAAPTPTAPSGLFGGGPGAGGATGRYITGNPFVTWPATGTRQGNVG